MADHLNYLEYEKQENTLILNCKCGWSGKANDAYGDMYEAVLDFKCPKCDSMLLIVNLVKESPYDGKDKGVNEN